MIFAKFIFLSYPGKYFDKSTLKLINKIKLETKTAFLKKFKLIYNLIIILTV